MSNKQARRAAKEPAAPPGRAPVEAAAVQGRSSRLRIGTGMLIVGGLIATVSALLPWLTLADGTTQAGIASASGVGVLLLGPTAVAIGTFILLRPNHAAARQLAQGALVAAVGIGALGVIAVLLGRGEGATAAAGVLLAITGGMVATLGVRGLLERR